jgi:hypothetical protein
MTGYFKKYEVSRLNWDTTFAKMMSLVVKQPEDLEKPLKQILCDYINALGIGGETLLHLTDVTPEDLSAPIKYGRIHSLIFELKHKKP